VTRSYFLGLLVSVIIDSYSRGAWAYTSVVAWDETQIFLGQNYDFANTHGSIFIHGRGKGKTSLGE